jgi:hypothetical protein
MTKPKKQDEIFQVIDGVPYYVGPFNAVSSDICCSCSLVHNNIYSLRTNKITGKKELWCRAVRDLKATKNLRRKNRR